MNKLDQYITKVYILVVSKSSVKVSAAGMVTARVRPVAVVLGFDAVHLVVWTELSNWALPK